MAETEQRGVVQTSDIMRWSGKGTAVNEGVAYLVLICPLDDYRLNMTHYITDNRC